MVHASAPAHNIKEWLARPTAVADFWPSPHSAVLGGRDLERSVHGTWVGVTKTGRLACLTNFHEDDETIIVGAQSRGAIVNAWLKSEGGEAESADQFAERLLESGQLKGVGGFTLMYGQLRNVGSSRGLTILSNRTQFGANLPHVATKSGETMALSNAPFGDRSWPKIPLSEALLSDAVKASVSAHESKEQLVERLMGVLSTDTMPEWDDKEEWKKWTRRMECSIFLRNIPLLGPRPGVAASEGVASPLRTNSPNPADATANGGETEGKSKTTDKPPKRYSKGDGYGTTKQTVILLSKDGDMTFVERTLWDEKERPIPAEERDRVFSFRVEEW